MKHLAFAADYDGTLARDGCVSDATTHALRRLKDSGRRLILVTGRRLEPLFDIFPPLTLFDCVVAENGALLYDPRSGRETPLAEPPPAAFAATLRGRGVEPLECGRIIVATWRPHEVTVWETIRDLGLELQIVFNKQAVMVLPGGVNKAAGLRAALEALTISPRDAIAVGDAENDEAMLRLCGASAAVANAIDPLKRLADVVLDHPRGEGVQQLVAQILEEDEHEEMSKPQSGVAGSDQREGPDRRWQGHPLRS